jgi:hypothetical protein
VMRVTDEQKNVAHKTKIPPWEIEMIAMLTSWLNSGTRPTKPHIKRTNEITLFFVCMYAFFFF